MKGFGVRYLCSLSSRNLSGSNFKAMGGAILVYVEPWKNHDANRLGPRDQCGDECSL